MKKLLPILLVLIGTGAGVGAGVFLRPPPPPMVEEAAEVEQAHLEEAEEDTTREYLKMTNQFVIPLVEDGIVSSLVAMSLGLEVAAGSKEEILLREPKLRDSFLQVLFDHANVGGFRGAFTEVGRLDVLRAALLEIAVRDAGDDITDVLIQDIARQDY